MEGLVNWWQAMTYLDVRSGTFLLYSCKVAFWSQEMSQEDCRMLSDQLFYSLCLWLVAHSLTYLQCFPGMCHSSTLPGTSLHVISFTFHHIITASIDNKSRWKGLEMRIAISMTSSAYAHFNHVNDENNYEQNSVNERGFGSSTREKKAPRRYCKQLQRSKGFDIFAQSLVRSIQSNFSCLYFCHWESEGKNCWVCSILSEY